jgi:excisionase family DNA binding protein
MILPHGHPPDLRWSPWDARQLRSASTFWGYDAVSKPQPVNQTILSKNEFFYNHDITYRHEQPEATPLTEQTSIVYTADQVEQIVELLFQKFTQHISSHTAADLDSSISQQSMPDTKLTLSVNEAAKMIGISKPKVYDLILEGDLVSIHVGKKIVIPKQAVTDWLSGGESNGKKTC